jgi:hypothetical protein
MPEQPAQGGRILEGEPLGAEIGPPGKPDAFLFAAHATMTLVNQKQVLISQASRSDGVRPLLISQLGNLQHIHTLKALGQAEQAAT